MDAFVHDPDHLGGFWRLIRRGAGKKFRETELAQVDPFGDGDNADSPIAEAGLELGDLLKWVFDFGDWYEYRLTLVDIIPAEQALPTAEYQRVVAQNAPAYKHCTECRTWTARWWRTSSAMTVLLRLRRYTLSSKHSYAAKFSITCRPTLASSEINISKLNFSHLPRTRSDTLGLGNAESLCRFHLGDAAGLDVCAQIVHKFGSHLQNCSFSRLKS